MTEYQKDANPGIKKYRGICTICEKTPTCILPRDPNRPLLYCDEFELSKPVPKSIQTELISSYATKVKHKSEKAKGSESYMGLCKLCDNRETCTFPKPEGGVWHCEEYT